LIEDLETTLAIAARGPAGIDHDHLTAIDRDAPPRTAAPKATHAIAPPRKFLLRQKARMPRRRAHTQ